MRRYAKYLISTFVLLISVWMILLRAQMAGPQVNQWTATPDMAMARDASCSVLMADGRVMVAGGNSSSGVVGTVDLFGPSGAFTAGPAMLQPRANAACVLLQDGRVLVTGGTDGKVALNSAEVFDPVKGAWSSAGTMNAPRYGHTATLLPWGAVLIVGGQSNGAVTDSVEAYLPFVNTFRAIGHLSSPRTDYAVAVVPGRRVLIAGGTDGSSVLNTIDVYQADTNTIVPGGSMLVPRMDFGAATLLDGRAMFAGGYGADGSVLASSEFFDPVAGTSTDGPQLPVSRAGHQAVTLQGNGTVLLVGGTDGNNTLGETDAYEPWTGKFTRKGALNTPRTGHTTSAMTRGGIITAGGINNGAFLAGGEIYNFAAVQSSKPDYQPGDVASFTGVGWKPGEQVQLSVEAYPVDQHGVEFSGTAVADSTGQISLSGFNIDQSHLGMRFLMTATGSLSTAQLYFTDGDTTAISISNGPTPASPQSFAFGTFSFTGTVSDVTNPSVGPPGPSGSATLTDNGLAASPTTTESVTPAGHTGTFTFPNVTPGPGPHLYSVVFTSGSGTWNNSQPTTFVYIVGAATTTTSISGGGSEPFGANDVTLTAVVNGDDTPPSGPPQGTLVFQDQYSDTCNAAAVFGTPGANDTTFTCTPTGLGVGTFNFTAYYQGYALTINNPGPISYPVYGTSNSLTTASITVNAVNTNVSLAGAPLSPVTAGQSVTVTATVTPAFGGPPAGNVQLYVDGVTSGAPVAVSGSPSQAIISWTAVAGIHNLTAIFSPTLTSDYNTSPSSAPLVYNVTPWSTTTSITSPITGSDAPFGTSVTFAATVFGNAGCGCGSPTGTVSFEDASNGNAVIATATLVPAGVNATVSTSVSNLLGGPHTIIAVYNVTGGFFQTSTSPSIAYTVDPATTTTVTLVNTPASPINMGTNVAFTAQVTPIQGVTPTGTVELRVSTDGGATFSTVGSAALINGQVTINYTFTSIPGTNPAVVRAAYLGDSNYGPAHSVDHAITVLINATSTTQVSTNAPGGGAPYGSSVTYTATVTISPASVAPAPAAALPGTVTWTDNGTAIAACAGAPQSNVTQGVGTITCTETGPLAPGGHTIVATYSGENTNPVPPGTITGSNGTANFNVTQNATTVTLTTQAPVGTPSTSSVYGQTMRMRAVVAVVSPGTGTPTGTVQFLDGTNVVGSGTLNGSGVTTFDTDLLSTGPHSLTATYLGDTDDATSSTTSAVTFTVNQDSDTVAVTFTPASPVGLGTPVTLTGTLTASAPGGGAGATVPTGTVTFYDNGVQIGTGTSTTLANATFTTSALAAGGHTFTATYSGDTNYTAISVKSGTSSLLTVNAATPGVTVVASPNPDIYGQAYTFTATVTGVGNFSTAGSGNAATVTFKNSASAITGCSNISVSNVGSVGTASCSPAAGTLAANTYNAITATYNADATAPQNYNSNTSANYSFTINPEPINFLITSNANPSNNGQSVTLTATATAPPPGAAAPPSGSVTFLDTFNGSGPSALPGGVCTNVSISTVSPPYTATCTLSTLAQGNHIITVTYTSGTGNTTLGAVTPVTQIVGTNATTTTLSTLVLTPPSTFNAGTTSVYGQTMRFRAVVAVNSPGTGTPTGNVQFLDGSTVVGSGTLNGASPDVATFDYDLMAVGTHSLTAVYLGDTNDSTSTTGTPVTFSVTQDTATVAVTFSPASPEALGTSITLTGTLTASSPGGQAGAATPTGTVTFYDNGVSIGTGTAHSPATFSTTLLSGGNHIFTATYSGDTNYSPISTQSGNSTTLTINANTPSVTVTANPNPDIYGQPYTLTATIVGIGNFSTAGSSGGAQLTFKLGSNPISGCTSLTVTAVGSVGTASCQPATGIIPTGGNAINASYVADTSSPQNYTNANTTAAYTLTINPEPINFVITANNDPAIPGQSITFTATATAPPPGAIVPAGGVTFYDGNNQLTGCINVPLTVSSPYTATCTQASGLALGNHIISVTFSPGNANQTTGTVTPLTEIVGQATVDFLIGSSNLNATYGTLLTFSVSVSPHAPATAPPAPTGSVTFFDGGVAMGPAVTLTTVSGAGTATLTVGPGGVVTTPLTVGTHTITVLYSGDSNFGSILSTNALTPPSGDNKFITQNVSKATPAVATVTAAPSPQVYGAPVTFSTTVSGPTGAPVPSGTVTFMDGTTVIGAPVNIPVTSGQTVPSVVSVVSNQLTVGLHGNITAVYNGDTNYSGNTSSAGSEQINRAPVTVTVAPMAPAVFGQAVTYISATVTVNSPSTINPGTASGSVTFFDNGVQIGSPALLNGNVANLATIVMNAPPMQNPIIGNHLITAQYNDTSGNYATPSAMSSPQTLAVGKAATTITVTSNANPSVTGQTITFTATVQTLSPGSGIPAAPDTVQFYAGAVALGSPVQLVTVGGVATAQIVVPNTGANPVSALNIGQFIISATYSGGADYLTSSTGAPALVQQVNQAATTTTIASSNYGGAVVGQQVTFTATIMVVPPGVAGVGNGPTGTVQFANNLASGNPTILGTAPVIRTLSGASYIYTATLTSSTIPVGLEYIQAVYSGDANYAGSTSTVFNQSINKSAVTITTTSNLNPSTLGQPVTFTFSVTPVAPATGIPTGVLVVYDGSNVLTNVALVGGQATYTVALGVGGHNIAPQYNGDANYQGWTGGPVDEIVNRVQSILNLTSNVTNAVASQVITFTAQIQPTPAPGVPYATGQIGFFMDGGTQIGVGQLQSGIATLSTTLPAGNHNIQALYVGDGNWTPAQSIYLYQPVGTATTTTLVVSSVNPSVWGQAVTFTVTVVVPFPGTIPANGQVQLYDNNNALGNPFSAANGTFSATFSSLAPGTHNIIAQFIANGSFSASASANLTQVVNKAPTQTTLMAFPSSSTSNQSVTMTAVVTVPTPGAGTPTGTVQFVDTTTSTVLGSSPLNYIGGVYTATLTSTALTQGSQTQLITATYSGDADFASSTSNPQGQSVFGAQVAVVNAAGYTNSNFAPDSLAIAFGQNLAYTSLSSLTTPLTTSLGGTTVMVTDSAGTSRLAGLLYVSLGQINFYVPTGTAYGLATVTVTNGSGETASTIILITPSAPGLFTANMNGQGVAAGYLVRVHSDGTQDAQVPLFQYDPNQKIYVPAPISMGVATDQLYLTLYGTGVRYGSKNVTASIGGITTPVLFAGAQPQYGIFGEDQINIGPIPASLKGAGVVNVYITVNGEASNTVTISIQ